MSKHINTLSQIIVYLMLVGWYSACQSTPDTVEESASSTEVADQAQIVLLTQTNDFDPATKAVIHTPYAARHAFVVPADLTPQNKWFMFEGPVLENDLIAYRYYADSRHRFDIYGKRVATLVMDTVSWDYHNIMDWGSDILKVGSSLGIGSPAIHYQDSLYTLSDCQEKRIEIVADEARRVLLRTTFKDLRIKNHVFDLVQDWELRTGEAWSTISLRTSQPLPEGMYFATGIARHLPDIKEARTETQFYAWNWGVQTFHEEEMGMAILASLSYGPEAVADEHSHVYVFRRASQKVEYRFLAAWARDVQGVKDADAFEQLVQQAGNTNE